ncbi:MAG: hypothetical protein WCK25_03975, partial [Actinomycetes bacterium]
MASLVFATTALMVISSGSDVLAGALGSYSGAGRPSPIFDLGALDVVATGTNGHLYQWSRNKSTFGWTAYDLTNNVGGVTISGSPTPIVELNQGLDVVATGTNGHLYQFGRDPRTFKWTAYDLSNNVGGTTVTGIPTPIYDLGALDVVATGTNGHLYQ